MASNPNQKNTQKQKTGIKTKNKHTIEFTNNTPTFAIHPRMNLKGAFALYNVSVALSATSYRLGRLEARRQIKTL